MDRDDSDSPSAAVIEPALSVCAYLKRKKEKRNELQDALMATQSVRVDLSPQTVEMVQKHSFLHPHSFYVQTRSRDENRVSI